MAQDRAAKEWGRINYVNLQGVFTNMWYATNNENQDWSSLQDCSNLKTIFRGDFKMKLVELKSYFLTSLLMGLTLILAGCVSAAVGSAPTPASVSKTMLTISGSASTMEVLGVLAEAYDEQHDDLTFEFLEGSGTNSALKALAQSQLDMVATSRLLNDDEVAAGLQYVGFGKDKVVIVTSADLSLPGLTSQQTKDIFLGQITNWSEVGGPNAAINVFVREEDSSLAQTLRNELFGETAYASGATIMTSGKDMRAALTRLSGAIGYVSSSDLKLSDIKVHPFAIDGQDPLDDRSNYLFIRSLGVAYKATNTARVQPFLDFLTSPQAQESLVKQGLIPAK
jgi:phosphate transport system substrate-binding protein